MPLSYTTLVADKSTQGSIANWASRTDLPVTAILEEAEAHIYGRLRAREMIKRAAFSLSAAVDTTDAPSDFISAISISLNGDSRPLDKMDTAGFAERCFRDEDGALPEGKPYVFHGVPSGDGGGTYYFETTTDQAYSGFQWYYHRPAALSPSNTTNFLTFRYPTLLRRACMIFAYEHRQDWQQMGTYQGLVQEAIDRASIEADTDLAGAIFDADIR